MTSARTQVGSAEGGESLPSFLESESSEYQTVSLTLPSISYHPEPIEWPTLFPHSKPHDAHAHSRYGAAHKQKVCNPLYRLVAQERYTDALSVLNELTSHKVHIQNRHVYLEPMVASLKMGNKAAALRWFAIYPNRPATPSHPDLKRIWEPVINLLITDRKGITTDLEFLDAFLTMAGRKGLLPTLLPPMLVHLAFSVPAYRSQPLLEKCISTYIQHTTSEDSETPRAQVQREIVRPQMERWWASYLRKLIIAGWKDDAKRVYEGRPMGVEWDRFTEKMARETLFEEHTQDKTKTNTDDFNISITDTSALAKQIRNALHDLPIPNQLASIIRAASHPLIAQEHPTLLQRFERRFTQPLGSHQGRTTSTIQRKLWLHADIINLQREGHHEEAIQLFRDNFIWIGLPDHPLNSDPKQSASFAVDERYKSYPTIQVITTLLPSLIYTLPTPLKSSIPSFFDLYIASVSSFPPSLRPAPATFSVLLRELTHHRGSLAGLRALRSISNSGLAPGEMGYAGVLLALAGKRHTGYMWSLLNQAEREPGGVGQRTYRGLMAVLIKTGMGKDAEKVYWRAREMLGREDVFDGLDVD
ncbi:hypothetical protein I317_01563 [Kwoniella heveanensis CBS 569]|nr:hypothetical protein I317_01563 [Kwoniella heveanensis CBS 569]